MRQLRLLSVALLAAGAPLLGADFSFESAGAPPTEGVPPALLDHLAEDGVKVLDPDGEVVAEYWGRKTAFEGDPVSAFGVRYDSIPEGALLALARFPDADSDFREQDIPAGLYTLRYTLHPEDGNHMGVAPSRDFAALTPAAEDTDPAKNYSFAELVALTDKIGNPHPTIARVTLPEGSEGPNLWQNDYEFWVLDLPVANDVVGIVVHGHSEE